jgi:hypothetical protein
MKRIIIYLTASLLFSCCTNNNNFRHYDLLKKAYDQHNYFKLNTLFNSIGFNEKNPELLLYKAKLEYVFNRPENSNIIIDRLIHGFKSFFNDTVLADLIEMRANNDFRLQEYNSACDNNMTLMTNYSHVLDSAKLVSIAEDFILRKAISEIPKMVVEKQVAGDITIPVNRDFAGLLNLPVCHDNDTFDFIFDTGANISVISKSFARKLGAHILPDKAKVNSIAGIKMDCELGYCDISLTGMEIKNTLFLVMEDSLLSFGDGYYVINGIIGFPVINALKEIIIKDDKLLILPEKTETCQVNNFALDNLNPTILVVYKNDSLPFHFDTGADKTILFNSFFEKYKNDIINNCSSVESSVTGAGGTTDTKAYLLDSALFMAGNARTTLDSLEVLTLDLLHDHQYVYGNFGQDFIRNYSYMKINFESMCISFSNNTDSSLCL